MRHKADLHDIKYFLHQTCDTGVPFRDWSLIMGRGGYKMGKWRVRNFLHPTPQDRVQLFAAPPPLLIHNMAKTSIYGIKTFVGVPSPPLPVPFCSPPPLPVISNQSLRGDMLHAQKYETRGPPPNQRDDSPRLCTESHILK